MRWIASSCSSDAACASTSSTRTSAAARVREAATAFETRESGSHANQVPLPGAAVARAGARAAMDRVELLEAAPGADGDAGQRRLGEVHGHVRLVAQPLVEAEQQRAAAGEHDAAIHDVGGEL